MQDLEHLKDFTMWLRNEGPGNTGRHNPIRSYFYWCYNAVSGMRVRRATCAKRQPAKPWGPACQLRTRRIGGASQLCVRLGMLTAR